MRTKLAECLKRALALVAIAFLLCGTCLSWSRGRCGIGRQVIVDGGASFSRRGARGAIPLIYTLGGGRV